jgi:hypothetical protein
MSFLGALVSRADSMFRLMPGTPFADSNPEEPPYPYVSVFESRSDTEEEMLLEEEEYENIAPPVPGVLAVDEMVPRCSSAPAGPQIHDEERIEESEDVLRRANRLMQNEIEELKFANWELKTRYKELVLRYEALEADVNREDDATAEAFIRAYVIESLGRSFKCL